MSRISTYFGFTEEPNWSKAHNILLPNFSQRAMQGYHPMMLDIAEQLVLKWERLNSDDEVDVVQGWKLGRNDSALRALVGRAYHHVVRLFFRLPVRDTDCDFRLMRRSIFERINLEKTSGIICVEMMKKVQDGGFRIAVIEGDEAFHLLLCVAYQGGSDLNVGSLRRQLH